MDGTQRTTSEVNIWLLHKCTHARVCTHTCVCGGAGQIHTAADCTLHKVTRGVQGPLPLCSQSHLPRSLFPLNQQEDMSGSPSRGKKPRKGSPPRGRATRRFTQNYLLAWCWPGHTRFGKSLDSRAPVKYTNQCLVNCSGYTNEEGTRVSGEHWPTNNKTGGCQRSSGRDRHLGQH